MEVLHLPFQNTSGDNSSCFVFQKEMMEIANSPYVRVASLAISFMKVTEPVALFWGKGVEDTLEIILIILHI